MKYKRILLITFSLLFLLTGCKGNSETKPPIVNSNNKPIADEQKYYAPYTGEEVTKDVANNTAFMAIIENASGARPQSGFTSADIVFEAMAEGGITRCFAIFQKENCAKIGPIRSMRTYFIDIAYEYNLPFAHCGGSHDALARIKAEKCMSMNEMTNGSYYWRDSTRKVEEHSLYSSTDKLRALVKEKGYAVNPPSPLKFDKSFWDNTDGSQASNIIIRFNGAYTTAYDFKDGLYYKSMNNAPTLNREDSEPVAVKNVVIQNVKYRSRPNESYLDADLVGTGDGYIISNGKAVKITWSRSSLQSNTVFKDESGKIVPLNPGKTWWHLLDQNAKLTIK